METSNLKSKVKGAMNWFIDWYMDLLTHRMLLVAFFIMIGLVFIKGGPLTFTYSDGTELSILQEISPSPFLGKLLIVLGFSEILGWDILSWTIYKLLHPILNPIFTPIFNHPIVKAFLTRIASKIPKEKNDDTDSNNEGKVS